MSIGDLPMRRIRELGSATASLPNRTVFQTTRESAYSAWAASPSPFQGSGDAPSRPGVSRKLE
jgi:hypothetical protein